jgi:hypothetical protein
VSRALALALASAIALCATAHADAPDSPGRPQRVAYIAGLLDAFAATPPAALDTTSNYIYTVERNKCQAPDESLHVGCVVAAVTRNCSHGDSAARDQCSRVSDVIATNRLSEKAFISDDVRYQLMESRRDYRAALARELHRRYAVLATELAMSPRFPGSAADTAALATGIEAYCREVSGTRELPWQYCVAALVWFIGTDGRTVKP